jgi:hypothetical protein
MANSPFDRPALARVTRHAASSSAVGRGDRSRPSPCGFQPRSVTPPLSHGGGLVSLREALVGMIEGYARHMGHADLLRERIDGRIGR